MTTLFCPVCAEELSSESLESHIRLELGLPAFRCRLCPARFYSPPEARAHPPQHPGAEECLEPQQLRSEDQRRLDEALRLAAGGPAEWVKRLCFCGCCQRLCHKDEETLLDQSAPAAYQTSAIVNDKCLRTPELEPTHCTDQKDKSKSAGRQPADGKKSKTARSSEGRPGKLSARTAPKREPASLGRVSCRECGGKAFRKEQRRRHVFRCHVKARPFACALCSATSFSQFDLAKHQRNVHKVPLTEDTFSVSHRVEDEQVQFWMETCFGESSGARACVGLGGRNKIRCGCGQRLAADTARNHVARDHLKEPMHKCRFCKFFVATTHLGNMIRHLRDIHKRTPGPDTVDSSGVNQYKITLDVMVKQFFAFAPALNQVPGEGSKGSNDSESESELKLPVDVMPDDWGRQDPSPPPPKAGESVSGNRLRCGGCGRLVGRSRVGHHVELHHLPPGNVYQCLLCPFGTRDLIKRRDHFLSQHHATKQHAKTSARKHGEKISPESFTRLVPKETVKRLIKDNFGDTQKLPWDELRCKGCDAKVRGIDRKRHIAVEHLKKAHFSCRVCGYEVMSTDRGQMNQHIRFKHKKTPGPENIDDAGSKKHEPVIQAMIAQLFPA